MKQARYLLASLRIQQFNRTPRECGGIGEGWSLAWAVRGDDDAPAFDEIEEGDLPDALDTWGLVVVTIEYDDDRAFAVDNEPAAMEDVADAMADRNGWRRL